MGNDAQYPVKGACQCGKVTYELTQAPLVVYVCHCLECQKLSAGAFSLSAIVNSDALKIHGELAHWERNSDSGNINAAKFCSTCGNRIYHYDPEHPEKIKLKPGTLSDTRMIIPAAHLWVSQKQQWVEIPPGVKQFDGQPTQ